MAAPLSAEEEHQYTQIIDGILAVADLETVTRKKIRMGLEGALGGKDLRDQKNAIKALIEERFDAASSAVPAPPSDAVNPDSTSPDSPPDELVNGHDAVKDEDDQKDDEIKVSVQTPKKKPRKEKTGTEDSDAKLAAQLQAEENSRTRATRGGGAKPAPKKKKAAPKKKSAKRVRPEDDSDLESDASGPKKRKAGGGFQKPFALSFPLATLCGEPQLSRPQVVKKLWDHIKGNELQDPSDKRQIRCDDTMYAVFKVAKVDMFQMNKLIGNHLYPVEEEQ
ncbi:hypothetical protein GGR56DRAFT_670550 [Xylariaceae sp. FL0804]|nr:hypothetical protein GGR56DRAFT_670550 [Xylariaceae sp. FL0804]